jgi:hypothetical protein
MRAYRCDPLTEIIGQQALAFVENVNVNAIFACLEKHHLTHVDPMTWYPLQNWLDVLNDIARLQSANLDFVAIGTAMAQTVWLPVAVAKMPVESFFLDGLNRIYQMQYRNGDAGGIRVKQVQPCGFRITVATPYPDELSYGVVYGFALRFLPRGIALKLEFDESTPRFDLGGANTSMVLEWA